MASGQDFVDFVCEQIRDAGDITHRKMFGEYAVYCGKKVVALVCDDQLFVKPTPAGKTVLGQPVEAPPYPSAKPWFLIEDDLDNRDTMTRLIAATEKALPEPPAKKARPRKVKKKKSGR